MSYNPNKLKTIWHNTRRTVAKNWFKFFKPNLTIAITGSQGKTNTTHILSVLFPEALVTDVNLDTIYNVPITALKLRSGQEVAIFELGIDKVGEMTKHLEIVKPNIVIVTGIAPVHTDAEHLGSLENLIFEKRKLIEILTEKDFAILNYDDENVRLMSAFTKAKVIWFGTDRQYCDYWFTGINKLDLNGINFDLHFGEKSFNVQGKLLGSFFAYNYLACFAALAIYNQQFTAKPKSDEALAEYFNSQIATALPLKGRMSYEQLKDGTNILNDSLRANISSTKAGLQTLTELQIPGKKFAVLGEMGEIGENEVSLHQELGVYISNLNLDYVIGIGKLQQEMVAAAKKIPQQTKYFAAANVIEAAKIIKENVNKGDLLYLKSSLLRHLERLTMLLENKEVGCSVVACPFYNPCGKCKYLKTGFKHENL
jgi:UDP-N-acetylmuramoyl-tripeptide--D-alanyl-D-alanine ligase